MIDQRLLLQKDAFLLHVCQKLGPYPIDFSEKWQIIEAANRSGIKHRAAGVLLLIQERPVLSVTGDPSNELFFILIKRSHRVSQGGDISCPGGMLSPVTDRRLAFLILMHFIPAFQGLPRDYAREKPAATYRLINLFLANAMRESWEEIRLNPFNVEFLGPLPTYSLSMFRRTIFPLVGYIKKPWQIKTSDEVDKMIEIPLKHFFSANHYGGFMIGSSTPHGEASDATQFPCFVHEEASGQKEILWGATFNIIMTFLKIIFNFSLPEVTSMQRFSRTLTSDYITGRPDTP